MRILGSPDREHVPRDENEKKVCEKLKALTGEDISRFETRAEYAANHFDEDDNPIEPGYDYVVSTSRRWKDWYVCGTRYGVNLREFNVEVEKLGFWTT